MEEFIIFLTLGNVAMNFFGFQPHKKKCCHYSFFSIGRNLKNQQIQPFPHLFHSSITHQRFTLSTFQDDLTYRLANFLSSSPNVPCC